MTLEEMLTQMSPEELQKFSRIQSMPQRNALLEEQMAQAEKLGSQPQQSFSTGLGAALGGLGDVVDKGRAAYQQKQLAGQMGANLDEGDKSYGGLLAAALRGQPATQPPQMQSGPALQTASPAQSGSPLAVGLQVRGRNRPGITPVSADLNPFGF